MISTVSAVSTTSFCTKSTAKRCLFGRLDHKIVNESLERELRAIDRRLVEKWDFDFTLGKPLAGEANRYAWSPISKSEYIPGPYLRDYPTKPTRPRVNSGKSQEQKGHKRRLNFDLEEELNLQEVAAEEGVCSKATADENTVPTTSDKSTTTRRVQQPRITAFYQQRKKQRTEKC